MFGFVNVGERAGSGPGTKYIKEQAEESRKEDSRSTAL